MVGQFVIGAAVGAFMVANRGKILGMPSDFIAIFAATFSLLIGIVLYELHIARGGR